MRFVVLVLLLVTGCQSFAPDDATPFDPPATFRSLWKDAQACSGRTGRFSELRFFVVPGSAFETPDGSAGARTEGHTIYLSEAYVDHPMVIKHEMLHALGIRHHPRHPFVDPCRATWASYRPVQ